MPSSTSDKEVLVLGCGLISAPLIEYLALEANFNVRIATRTLSKTKCFTQKSSRITATFYDVEQDAEQGMRSLTELVPSCSAVVSLLPYIHHVAAAKVALAHSKHFFTCSYISDAMMELDAEVKEKGLLFLNECGVDPGLDHMSCMAVIDGVHEKDPNARIVYMRSVCGGLPAPAHNNNPLGYKLSWSPRGVLLAGRNPAKILRNDEVVNIPGPELFAPSNVFHDSVEGVGPLEWYYNRDSVKYAEIYRIKDVSTIIRGTYRYHGWSRLLYAITALHLNSTEVRITPGCTYAAMVRELMKAAGDQDPKQAIANALSVKMDDEILRQMEWLGLFSETLKLPDGVDNPLDALCFLMQNKMGYEKHELDMIAMKHVFEVEWSSTKRSTFTSTLVNIGLPDGESAMARTVALPLAIAIRAALEGDIKLSGVVRPVVKELYQPILDGMKKCGISIQEAELGPMLWLRAESKEGEQRSALVPASVEVLIKSGFRVVVEQSPQRCFPDSEFAAVGAEIVPSGSWTSAPHSAIIIGLKELPLSGEPLRHRHVYFAHAFKGQDGWKELLQRFALGGGHLWDLEYLVDANQRRVAAFGRSAGIVGTALALQAWATEQPGPVVTYESSAALASASRDALSRRQAAPPSVLVIGAKGRCGQGATWMAQQCGVEVTEWDIEETKAGGPFPELLNFDIVVNCICLSVKVAPFLTREMMESSPRRRLTVLSDVSCDYLNPNNPFPVYNSGTTLKKPFVHIPYGEVPLKVLAVDHLPTVIPIESSQEFSNLLVPHVLALKEPNASPVWDAASTVFKQKITETA